MSLPRKRRLTSSKEINNLLQNGHFYRGNYCHLICSETEDNNSATRAAFIVSTKTAPRAVYRNRIKRLMKESFRLRMDGISRGYKLIFIATRKAKPDFKRQDFEAEINNLLTEAGLFAKTNQPAD